MTKSAGEFARWLTKTIRRITADTGQSIASIQDEIGYALGKKGGSLLAYWRRGNLPAELGDLEQLGRELVKREGLRNGKELEEFLDRGGHPNPAGLTNELFPQPLDTSTSLLYRRLKMESKRKISAQGLVTSFYQTEIQSITDAPLPSIRHRRMANEMKLEDPDLHFTPGYRDGPGGMRKRVESKSEKLLVWTVEFDPPLLKHQRASYSHVQTCRGIHAMTFEDCRERFVAGHSHGKFEYWRFKMTVPTEKLRMVLELPPNYPISLPPSGGFAVYLDSAEHLREKARLTTENCFSALLHPETNQWILELNVHSAQMGLGYQIQWIPPRSAAFSP